MPDPIGLGNYLDLMKVDERIKTSMFKSAENNDRDNFLSLLDQITKSEEVKDYIYYLATTAEPGAYEKNKEPEPGYGRMVLDRLRDMGKQVYGDWQRGDLEALTGVTALAEQYGEYVPSQTSSLDKISGSIPCIGPSIKQIGNAAGRGEWKEAAAQATTDLGLPLATHYAAKGISRGLQGEKPQAAIRQSAIKNYKNMALPKDIDLHNRVGGILYDSGETGIPGAMTRKRLQQKVAALRQKYGAMADEAFEKDPTISVDELLAKTEQVRHDLKIYVRGTNEIPFNKQRLNAVLTAIEEDLIDFAAREMDTPDNRISSQLLDDFLDTLRDEVTSAKGEIMQNVSPKSRAKIFKAAGGAIRSYLDTEAPSGASINKLIHAYIKMDDALKEVAGSRESQTYTAMRGTTQGMGGTLRQIIPRNVMAGLQAVSQTFDSVPWQSMSAKFKQNFANAIMLGDIETLGLLVTGSTMNSAALRNQAVANAINNIMRPPSLDFLEDEDETSIGPKYR